MYRIRNFILKFLFPEEYKNGTIRGPDFIKRQRPDFFPSESFEEKFERSTNPEDLIKLLKK